MMKVIPQIVPQVGKTAMDRLRETIHENDALNKAAARAHYVVTQFFKQQSLA